VGGNTRERTLEEIWERSEPLRYNRDRTVDALWGFCRSCYYADECRAGCTWMATSLFGRPGNNPYCHHRALEFEKAGQRERVVQRAPAPGSPFDHGLFEIVVEPTAAPGSRPRSP
jgi:sulfatase maturation enzyme AslB (radical SAM superfamily)